MELLSALRHHGPATASMLAERLGESSGATSYHLRQLATYGFVVDAPERGKGRERWWQAAEQGIAMDEDLLRSSDPSVRGSVDVFLHEVATSHAREVSTWVATLDDWLPKWSQAMDMSDWTLRLTPELGEELLGQMHELIESYNARSAAEDDPEAERVRLHMHLFPTKTD
jgi:DNA-binding transcriptional ArsR family regulator